mgnify:CR=1 FL=1
MHRLAAAVAAALGAALVATPSGVDATVHRSSGLATRKSAALVDEAPPPVLATLVQTHTGEHVPLDDHSPTPERFSALLADRVTGERIELDARLLELLRSLARRHPGARIELVSGYRSPKLNEMLRKKGHNVASSSQHSLGHAVDFRVIEPDAEKGIHPRVLEREIRELGWKGGVGVYPTKFDWFVHADVGRLRRWEG